MEVSMRLDMRWLMGALLLTGFAQVQADTGKEEELVRMQRQLNQETMDKPFHAEDPEKVDAYIKEASKNHIKPLEYSGPHWQAGYTCHDMLRYSWIEYRDCRYYHHYYGHYYSYP
jgi:hypothetical protein